MKRIVRMIVSIALTIVLAASAFSIMAGAAQAAQPTPEQIAAEEARLAEEAERAEQQRTTFMTIAIVFVGATIIVFIKSRR